MLIWSYNWIPRNAKKKSHAFKKTQQIDFKKRFSVNSTFASATQQLVTYMFNHIYFILVQVVILIHMDNKRKYLSTNLR